MQIFKAKVFYFIILITTVSCTSTAEVFFQDVVDTSDKEIKFQEKKIFSFDKSGVYFSNDFDGARLNNCLLYTSPSPRDGLLSRMPSSA